MDDSDNGLEAFRSGLLNRELEYPSRALAHQMLDRALSGSQKKRLKAGVDIALVIVVPQKAMLHAVGDALEKLSHDEIRVLVGNTSVGAGLDEDLSGVAAAAGGRVVVHVCTDTGCVPLPFLALSEAPINLAFPDAEIVGLAMTRTCVGRVPGYVKKLDVSGIPWRTLCALIPRGAAAAKAAKALRRVVEQDRIAIRDLPSLEDCLEYGSLRTWGLALKADLAAWRQGNLAWADLVSQAAILLSGEPGVGKTHFAKILSADLNIPLLEFGIGDLFANGGYLNTTLKALRDVFGRAAENRPCILFLDEIDSLPSRGSGGGNDAYFDGLVNELLVRLDEPNRPEGVIVIAATNRPDAVDPAIKRAGRLSRHIAVGRPDEAGVAHILQTALGSQCDDMDLGDLPLLALGYTAAEITYMVSAAKGRARSEGRPLLAQDIFSELRSDDGRSEAEIYRVAIHEAGHAIMTCLREGSPPHRLSIVQKGDLQGYSARSYPRAAIMTRDMLTASVEIMLAGLAAESVVFGEDVSTGSGGGDLSDLGRASATLGMMRTSWGVCGSLLYRGDRGDMLASFAADPQLRDAVEADLRSILNDVKAELSLRKPTLLGLAETLTEKLVLRGPQIEGLLAAQKALEKEDGNRWSGDELGKVVPFVPAMVKLPRPILWAPPER